MARSPKKSFSEKELTKGELRKLNALKKSVGDKIGERAFADWLKERQSQSGPSDRNAEMLAAAVAVLRKNEKGFRIPRGGYLVTTGRGGVSVRPAKK